MGYNFRVTTSKDKIINIKNKYDEMVSYFLGIDIGVRKASRKTSVKEKDIHFGIPSSRSLFKATNKARVILNISRRLFPANFLL